MIVKIETCELCSYGCGQIAKFEFKNGELCCNRHYSKCPMNRKRIKLTINQIKERYQTFSKVEDLRYNPNKPNTNEIQVRYKYDKCKNSKENLQAYHEKPQKTHPGMILDPDNGIILCKNCHYKYGHKTGTECSTGNLANYNPCN